MLIQFNFENFKSFRDKNTLDFTATKSNEFNEQKVNLGEEKILPVAAIFGANASGKSNVLEAFKFMRDYVLKSFMFGGELKGILRERDLMKQTPFLFDKTSENNGTMFEVYFIDSNDIKEKTYNYGFVIKGTTIIEEWLNEKSKTSEKFNQIFYRENDTIEMPGIQKKMQQNIKYSLENEVLILSLGAKLRIDILKLIVNWFVNISVTSNNIRYSNLISLKHKLYRNNYLFKKAIPFLNSFDDSINNIKIEKEKSRIDNYPNHLTFLSAHKIDGTNELRYMPFENESDGTIKMLSLFPYIDDVLIKGSVLVIDELNSKLHPLLVRVLLQTFLNVETNPKHAQIIFTTHDAGQLNLNLLRRDEIWFTKKQQSGNSCLYSLADFIDDNGNKIRKDENYTKNYLLGKYGAIPNMKAFNFKDNDDGEE